MRYFIYKNEGDLKTTNYYENFLDGINAYDEILNSCVKNGKYYFGVESDFIDSQEGYCFDLIHMEKHRKENFVFLIKDYENHKNKKDFDTISTNIKELKKHYSIEWKYCSLIGTKGCYIPIEDIHNSYIEDKILLIPIKKNKGFYESAINEVNVQGKGWIPYKELNESSKRFCISSVNVNYIKDNGQTGQMDISSADAITMISSMKHSYQLIGCLDRRTSVEDGEYYPVLIGSYETKEEAVKAFYNVDAEFINKDCKKRIVNKGEIVAVMQHLPHLKRR